MKITNVTDNGATFTIYLSNSAPIIREVSGLILKFKKNPVALLSIGRVDYEGNNTQTDLSAVDINDKIDSSVFIFKKPKKAFPNSQ
jgi:hypothetical protein